MKYRAAYKCPLCRSLLLYGDAVNIPHNNLPDLLGEVVKNQQFAGNPYLHQAPMHIFCKCPNGDAGLATFSGFVHVSDSGKPQIGGREVTK